MKNNRGLTLLELLVAINISTLVFFAGGGVYLSSINMSSGVIENAKTVNSLQIAIAHIKKNVSDCASDFQITMDGKKVEFLVYGEGNYPTIKRVYELRDDKLFYSGDAIIADNISGCSFGESGDRHNLIVNLSSTDKYGNICSIEKTIVPTSKPIPCVFKVG